MKNKLFEEFWKDLSSTLLNHYLHKLIDKVYKENESFHKSYAELLIKIYLKFGDYAFFNTPSVNEEDKLNFTKEFLHYCDLIADITMNNILHELPQKILDNRENRFQKELHLRNIFPITEETTSEEIQLNINAIRKLHDENRKNDERITEKFERVFLNIAVSSFTNFLELYSVSNSPLKEAFIFGFLSYYGVLSWTSLTYLKHYDGRFNLDNYNFDFIIENNEENIKLAIKLDDNGYYERPESQSVIENVNDRMLTKQGWKVLRFHPNEIEKNIKNCILKISQKDQGNY